ncbi:MAG: hypothetical protein Q6366_017600 [Candidatus Freyarchaeota archaeon]
MLKEAPYDLPDSKALMDAHLIAVREQEKVYGRVFLVRFIKHALQFMAQRIGRVATEDIKTLDHLAEYLLSKTDKRLLPNLAFYYAQIKTENELQGRTGATYRIAERSFYRKYVKSPSGETPNVDLEENLLKLHQFAIDLKLSPKELGYKKNEDESLDIILPNCYFKEVCQQAFKENILTRADGKMHCAMGATLCQYFKLIANIESDYNCIEFDKPHCIIRCYTI